jgi:hypothetical protein
MSEAADAIAAMAAESPATSPATMAKALTTSWSRERGG